MPICHAMPLGQCREGNDIGQDSAMTYQQLLELVCQIANYLTANGVKKGDDVTIYMPMIPELPATMVSAWRMCRHGGCAC